MPGRSGSSPPSTSCASRPCTSVPDACPGAGCTTRPAGLSTISRCSSSYGTARSIASGSRVLFGAGGGSNSTDSPPVSLWLFSRARPSTSTPPEPSRRSATAREPISGSSARKLSSRRPAASSGTSSRVTCTPRRAARVPLGRDESREKNADADDDEAVGEVERGPVTQIEEVGHVAEAHAVEQVAEAAADHEAERNGQDRMPSSRPREEEQHPADCDRRQPDHRSGGAREEPECDAGVLHVVNPEDADDVVALVEHQMARDDRFRQLVGGDSGERDRRKAHPL